MSAPAGIAIATSNSATIATGTNFDQVAQRDTNQTTGRRWIHNVGASISLFVAGVANTISLKLIAAKGKVQMQAQSGEIEVTADQAVKISSVQQDVTLAAAKNIIMTSGGGYVKIGGGDIHMHCPGEFSIKCSRLVMEGAVSLVQEMPELPNDKNYSGVFEAITKDNGQVLANRLYTVTRADGRVLIGKTDEFGKTIQFHTRIEEKVKVAIDAEEKLFRDKVTEEDVNSWLRDNDV